MDRVTKEKALWLLGQKADGAGITYSEIALETGYSKQQLIRLSHSLEESGEAAALAHGNSVLRPHNTARPEEIAYLRKLKEPYPNVTIAHFKDIYIEDVLENPEKANDVGRYGLCMRGPTWFRELFAKEGWRSPAFTGKRGDADATQHPMREPLPRMGMMAQVDATPYDWLSTGESWCRASRSGRCDDVRPRRMVHGDRMHARMMIETVSRRGILRSMYSDKDSVFRTVKDGSPTQFAFMMRDLGIRMIFAGSPQAKGRVERYNSTAQMRLPTDAARFGIDSYDKLNSWFNDFYAPYLNAKFSYPPRDPVSDFIPLPEGTDLSRIFRTRETRVSHGCTISYGGARYMMADADGVVLEVPDGTVLDVHVDAVTEEMYVERSGRRWGCRPISPREPADISSAPDRRGAAASPVADVRRECS